MRVPIVLPFAHEALTLLSIGGGTSQSCLYSARALVRRGTDLLKGSGLPPGAFFLHPDDDRDIAPRQASPKPNQKIFVLSGSFWTHIFVSSTVRPNEYD